jgi:putative FmdB family regulatory protein
MPTYEYECTRCGKVFELFQSITEKPKRRVKAELKNCDCDAPVLRHIGTGGGLIFKGSGFYQTDYRSESYKKAEKAEKQAATPKTDGKSDSKSKDTKPAKKGGSTKQPSEAA